MVTDARRMSLDEFLAWPDDGQRYELVEGERCLMSPVGRKHGRVESALTEELGLYLRERARAAGWLPEQGVVARDRLVGFVAGGEFGMQFTPTGGTVQVRGADAVYVPPEQAARVSWDGEGYYPEVPALVIEVVSPSETAAMVDQKVLDYLQGGGRHVWCVYPDERRVHIYDVAGPARVVRWGTDLSDPDILPGFSVNLLMLFSPPVDR